MRQDTVWHILGSKSALYTRNALLISQSTSVTWSLRCNLKVTPLYSLSDFLLFSSSAEHRHRIPYLLLFVVFTTF